MIKDDKITWIHHSNAFYAVKQSKEQRYYEAVVLATFAIAGLAAFFLIAPCLHYLLFWFYNLVSGKDVQV